MKVCGIDIKGNNAILSCLEGDKDGYVLIAESTRKIGLEDSKSQEDVRGFSRAINAFFEEMNFDKVAIKARGEKGRFAGGPTSFKIEGLIQNTAFEVEVIHGATVKSKIKGIEIDFASVKKYQEESLKVAVMLMISG